jgi:beta-glucosidase
MYFQIGCIHIPIYTIVATIFAIGIFTLNVTKLLSNIVSITFCYNCSQTAMTRIFFIISLLSTVTFSSFAQQIPLYKNPKLSVDERVKDLLSRMTPEEKFWQLFMIPGDLDNADSTQYKNGIFGFQVSAASKGDAGGQMLNYNTKETGLILTKKINSIQKYFVEHTRLGIPIIAFDEALHGLVRDGATSFPQSIALRQHGIPP